MDFAENTPDGKRTFHGTAMAVYQKVEAQDEISGVTIDLKIKDRSVKDLPECAASLMESPPPYSKPKPIEAINKEFDLLVGKVPLQTRIQDVAWLFGREFTRVQEEGTQVIDPTLADAPPPLKTTRIPVWSAYNLLISDPIPTARVGTPPLVSAPAHECSTLLTVLMQAQSISAKVVGLTRKTVISLDLGLYAPAKQLQMSRNDMAHLILRPGELHIIMAELCTIGAFIDNSGLDFCWTESELYGTSTVNKYCKANM